MAFKLRSQSPVKQAKKPKTLQEYNKERFGSNTGSNTVQSQPMLSPSGKTEYKLTKNNKDITKTKEGKQYASSQKQKNMEDLQDRATKSKPNIFMADPTGVSSWGDAKRAMQHMDMMAESGNWKKDRLAKDALDILGAVPVLGKATTVLKGANVIAKPGKVPVMFEAASVLLPKIKSAAAAYLPDKISEQISNKKKVEPTAKKSGVMSNKSGQTPPKKNPIMMKDLSGDGKITKKDVLIGRGVIKKDSPVKQTVKDACYKKVKAKYDVFPSAYASGAIAKCRKNKGKK